jgi:hypothetical protein
MPYPSEARSSIQIIVGLFVLILQRLAQGLRKLLHGPMPRLWKRSTVATGMLFLISLGSPAASPAIFDSKSSTSSIVDFRPTSFEAKATGKFFYSVGNELKYSDQIDPHVPTSIRGPFTNFQVSPNGNMIAVVVKKQLLIIGADSELGDVGTVDSIYRGFKPVGRSFFRDEDFQWSRESKSLYLIRDEYYHSKGSQLFSKKGELWRYDLDSRSLHLVLKPFAAHAYFFGVNSGIYYSEPTLQGDLQLKFFDGHNSINVGKANSDEIFGLAGTGDEWPFYSFSTIDYQKALPSLNVRLVNRNGLQDLLIGEKKYLSVTQGYYWLSGYDFCSRLLRSVFLPGNRYFLLNVPFCNNYKGQLLFDLESAQYQELPLDTVVFSTLNTLTFKRYVVTAHGIEIE